MKKRISMLLCLVLVLSAFLCGCGPDEKEALIGSWTGSMDLTAAVNEGIAEGLGAENADMVEYLTVNDLKMVMTITFNEDDTYTMVVDEAALEEAMRGMMDDMVDGLVAYFETMLKAEGLDMTVDELLSYSGMTVDTLAEEMFGAMTAEEMFGDLNSEGNFKVSEGRLYLSDGLEYAVDLGVYETYTIEGNTLTIDKGNATDENEAYLYPMVFTKN